MKLKVETEKIVTIIQWLLELRLWTRKLRKISVQLCTIVEHILYPSFAVEFDSFFSILNWFVIEFYDKNKCKIVDSVHVLVFSHFYVKCLTDRHVIQKFQNINDNTLPIHAKKSTINNILKTSSL